MKILMKICLFALLLMCCFSKGALAVSPSDFDEFRLSKDTVVFVGQVISDDTTKKPIFPQDKKGEYGLTIDTYKFKIKIIKKLWGDIEEGKTIVAERKAFMHSGSNFFGSFLKEFKKDQIYLLYLCAPSEKKSNYFLPATNISKAILYGVSVNFVAIKGADEPVITALEKGIKFLTADNAVEEQIKILKSFLADENPYLQFFALAYVDRKKLADNFADIIKKQYIDMADKIYAELFVKADKIYSSIDKDYSVSDYRYKQFFKVLQKVQGSKYSRDHENDLAALDIETASYGFRYAREQIVAEILRNAKVYNKQIVASVISRMVSLLPKDKKEPDKTTRLIIEYYINLLEDEDALYASFAISFFRQDTNREIINKTGVDKKIISAKIKALLERFKNKKGNSLMEECLKENLQFYEQ